MFVAINKNIFNDDLKDLENNLIELSKLNIKGILFYDLSILSIVKRLDLKLDLVYNQGHLVTNYNIVEFYKKVQKKIFEKKNSFISKRWISFLETLTGRGYKVELEHISGKDNTTADILSILINI